MARTNLLKITCDFCSNTETFDQNEPKSMKKEKIHKWIQMSRADDPVVGPMGNQIDPSRWADSKECVLGILAREDRQSELEEVTNKVNAVS
jgi:hypothetical protein